MCGIAGFQTSNTSQTADIAAWLDAATTVLHARGPDDRGTWLSQDCRSGLAHTRLAILDLSQAGHQPMALAEAGLNITFNGEIYNWRELRRELETAGIPLRSHTDTEVLLHLYARHGTEMIQRLRGMFAFAIHDAATGTIFCARDSLGKKPLVYAEFAGGVIFASTIPSVLRLKSIPREVDRDALAAMLLHNLRHIPDPHTAYKHVRRLRPGHAMLITGGRVARSWRWWTPTAESGPTTPQILRKKLEEAIRIRLVADVPVGALLSGGVDSSAIVHLMTRLGGSPVRTYALGMDAQDEDLRRARSMAARLGSEHREFYFDAARQWQVFKDIIATFGEPIMLLPLIHTHELCRAIREDGIRVVLAGHGADELFCGYTGHIRTAMFSRVLDRIGPCARRLRWLTGSWSGEALAVATAQRGDRKAALYRHKECEAWSGMLSQDARRQIANRAAEEMALWGALTPSESYIEESNFSGLLVENAHSVTIATDLPAMMHGVEMRAPFLDQDIVSFALGTPLVDKVPGRDPSRLKHILKQAVADIVPHDLLYAPKRGFGMGIPESALLRGAWNQQARQLFAQPHPIDGLFDPEGLKAAWKAFSMGGPIRADRLAKVMSIQWWAQNNA